jgi:hypothetical protein
MYAGVIASAVHDALRRALAIAAVHARTNLLRIAKQGGDYFGTLQSGPPQLRNRRNTSSAISPPITVFVD